jgi:methionine-rich copper-binding protein CopC
MSIVLSHTASALRGRLRTALLTAAIALTVTPAVALAHGRLVASNPAADSRITAAPRELRLTFSEKAELAVSRVRLLGPDGKAVALAPLTASDDEGRTVVAAVQGSLAPGAYTVEWQLVGRDGHPVRGKFSFVVGAGAAAPTAGEASTGAAGAGAHAGHGAQSTAPAPHNPAKPAAGSPPPAGARDR